MKAENWGYLAEGNHHVVLRHIAADSSSPYVGKVLRIAKEGMESFLGSRDSFLLDVLKPVFTARYIQRPIPIALTLEFLEEIADKIEECRPVGRRSKSLPRDACGGLLETDLTVSLGRATPLLLCVDRPICIEIKVKCGLKPCSPLIEDKYYSIKTRNSKYALMQLVKCAKDRVGEATPWGSHIRTASAYDPADVCSGDPAAVQRALRSLVSSPQNNFIVYDNGTSVYGLRSNSRYQWLRACRALCPTAGGAAEAAVLEAVAGVLCREDALRRLEFLQALDVLDVEGAAAVLDQLASAMGGGVEQAASLVDRCMPSHAPNPTLASVISGRLSFSEELLRLLSVPVRGVDTEETPAMQALRCAEDRNLSLSDIFILEESLLSDLYALRVGDETPVFERLRRKHEARAYISKLGALQCVLLLRLWLIALGASDASVMLCMARGDDTALSSERSGRLQSESEPGLCICTAEGISTVIYYSFCVTDVGPKPASKILSKAKVENKNCEMATQEEESQKSVL